MLGWTVYETSLYIALLVIGPTRGNSPTAGGARMRSAQPRHPSEGWTEPCKHRRAHEIPRLAREGQSNIRATSQMRGWRSPRPVPAVFGSRLHLYTSAAFEKCMEPLKINKMCNTLNISSKMYIMRIFLRDSDPFPSFPLGNCEYVA